MYRILS